MPSASTSGLELQTVKAHHSFSIQSLLAPVGTPLPDSFDLPETYATGCAGNGKPALRLPNIAVPRPSMTRIPSILAREKSLSLFQRFAIDGRRNVLISPLRTFNCSEPSRMQLVGNLSLASGSALVQKVTIAADATGLRKGQDVPHPLINSDSYKQPVQFSFAVEKPALGEILDPVSRVAPSHAPEQQGPSEKKSIRGYWDTVLLPSSPCSGFRSLESSIEKKRKGLLAGVAALRLTTEL